MVGGGALQTEESSNRVHRKRSYDNWLVSHAANCEGVDLIDITRTAPVVHITGSAGNKEGFSKKDVHVNYRMAEAYRARHPREHAFNWYREGTTEHATKITVESAQGEIKLCSRRMHQLGLCG